MSPRKTRSLWAEKGDEMLADGKWHHGPTFIRELLKVVPPGIALRELEAERVRERAGGLQGVEEWAQEDEPMAVLLHRLRLLYPRRSAPSDDALIETGKMRIVRIHARDRLRSGRWDLRGLDDLPRGDEWRRGEWDIRDRDKVTRALSVLASQYGMSVAILRRIVEQYQVPALRTGRVTRIHLDDLVTLDRAVEKYRHEERDLRIRRLVEMRQRQVAELNGRRRGTPPAPP